MPTFTDFKCFARSEEEADCTEPVTPGQLWRTNICNYYSTNARAAHIWSKCERYLSSVHNRYPAIYVGCENSSEVL